MENIPHAGLLLLHSSFIIHTSSFPPMSLLIDGYNLIHAAGLVGRGRGPGGLERSRLALLNFLAESLPAAELARTTVVFDAAGAPPGLPDTLAHRGLKVRFARGYASADELIEELICEDSSPKRLTVVSSDHRLQRAAHRRKARAIDSDRWYAETIGQRAQRQLEKPEGSAKPVKGDGPGEVEYWLSRFDDQPGDEKSGADAEADEDIFPPGYAEDIE
jgi:hypothetical protein